MSKASISAYETIRQKILDGTFKHGEHLKEEELAVICGVSRTPVRDALRNLAADDYVENRPNQGTIVKQWSAEDIEEIFTLRAMLEGHSARLAAHKVSKVQLRNLRQCHDRIAALINVEGNINIEAFLDENQKFHTILTDASGSRRLANLISRLVAQPVVARTAISYSRDDLTHSNAQHTELIEALESGNDVWAESVMRSHILSGYQKYRRYYQK